MLFEVKVAGTTLILDFREQISIFRTITYDLVVGKNQQNIGVPSEVVCLFRYFLHFFPEGFLVSNERIHEFRGDAEGLAQFCFECGLGKTPVSVFFEKVLDFFQRGELIGLVIVGDGIVRHVFPLFVSL